MNSIEEVKQVMETEIQNIIMSFKGNPNDKINRSEIIKKISPIMSKVSCLDEYKVVCNEENNTPKLVYMNILRTNIVVKIKNDLNEKGEQLIRNFKFDIGPE